MLKGDLQINLIFLSQNVYKLLNKNVHSMSNRTRNQQNTESLCKLRHGSSYIHFILKKVTTTAYLLCVMFIYKLDMTHVLSEILLTHFCSLEINFRLIRKG